MPEQPLEVGLLTQTPIIVLPFAAFGHQHLNS